MNSISESTEIGRIERVSRTVLVILWQLIRLPVLAFLIILEPLVSFFLSACALIGVLCAFFFKLTSNRPDFPFWGMLAGSLGCVALLAVYHGVIRLFSGR